MEGYFRERFGIPPHVLKRFHILKKGNTYLGLSRASTGGKEPPLPLKVVSVGLPLLREVGRYLKPTSAALRLFSAWITKNRVLLQDEEVWELLSSRQISLRRGPQDGYVLVETHSMVIGCGLCIQGRLRCQVSLSELRPLLDREEKPPDLQS